MLNPVGGSPEETLPKPILLLQAHLLPQHKLGEKLVPNLQAREAYGKVDKTLLACWLGEGQEESPLTCHAAQEGWEGQPGAAKAQLKLEPPHLQLCLPASCS